MFLSQLFRRFARKAAAKNHPRRPARRRLKVEGLEDRRLLAAITFANDNWDFLTDSDASLSLTQGDLVVNNNDTIANGLIVQAYGVTAFGTVTTGAFTGSIAAYDEIEDAIAATDVGGTVNVLEGTYVENVAVGKSLTLAGAQAGNDARVARGVESIVDGDLVDATFAIAADVDDVIIDGFTIQGGGNGLNTGVHITGTSAGYDIKNNIITDNVIGVYANSDGAAQIRQNLFDGNNEPGAAGGAGIYTDQGTLDLEITDNKFINHTANNPVILAATLATSNTNLVFSGNELDNDFGVYALKIINGTFENNDILTDDATALHVGAGSSNVQVLNNDLSGNARGLRVADFDDFGVPLPASGVTATYNDLSGSSDFGLVVLASGHTGNVDASANYWGTSDPAAVAADIDMPDSNVDFTPLLDNGDANLVAIGFQEDLSSLTVHTLGQQVGATGRIQEGINLVTVDGTVNVAAGTYSDIVTISKALTLSGETTGGGDAAATLQPSATGDALILLSGAAFGGTETVTIENINLDGTNGAFTANIGVNVPGTVGFDTLNVSNGDISGFVINGISVFGNSTTGLSVENVNLSDLSFTDNGNNAINNGGKGDVTFFEYNGDAALSDLTMTGLATSSTVGPRNAIQFRGIGTPPTIAVPVPPPPAIAPMGTVSFTDISVTGDYVRSFIGLQRYQHVNNLTLSNVVLGGAGSSITGTFGAVLRIDAVGQGTVASPAAIDLGNTHFRGIDDYNPAFDIEFAPDNTYAFLRADATDTLWNTTVGAGVNVPAGSLTLAQLFEVEDRIIHYSDVLHPMNGTFKGFAEVRDGNAYVTASTQPAPGSITRAVEVVDLDGTVNVAAGTYLEQVFIGRDVHVVGVDAATAIIQAPVVMVAGANGHKNIVTISGATTDAELTELTVTGPGQVGEFNNVNHGIYVRDGATADIHDNIIKDVRDQPLSGVQTGHAIRVGRQADATTGTATITDNQLFGYQKTGIIVDNTGSSATITGNTITGAGLTGIIAQNGVQISRGATASISGNTISGHDYNDHNVAVGTGILLFESGGSVSVSDNDLDANDVGIYALNVGAANSIDGNTLGAVTENTWGIVLDAGTAAISDNDITGGDVGIELDAFTGASTATVTENTISAADIGVLIDGSDGFTMSATIGGAALDANTITGGLTGILVVGEDSEATIKSNEVTGNSDVGIEVDDGVALIESNDLTNNGVGILIRNGGLVDAGSIQGDGSADPTNLNTGSDGDGSSTGGNQLTGYTGVSGSFAIENLNLDAGPHPNVEAENNNFGLNNPEAVVFHTVDVAANTLVDFSPSVSATSIIDDGDAGFTTTFNWTTFANQGFQNDITYAPAGAGGEVATWTFTGLLPGQYRVSATWHLQANRATNSPFTVLDNGNPLATVLINQELAPNDFSSDGAFWEDLGGPHNIASGTLVVRLTDFANEFVIADAIRIERIGEIVPTPELFVIDDGDAGFTTTGGWTSFPNQGFQSDITYAAAGSGSEVATWTFTGLTAGQYRISATWHQQANRATNSPFTVLDGANPLNTVAINQEIAPNDFSAGGASWEDLGGPYNITSGSVVVRLTNAANEFVIADAIRIERIGDLAPPAVIFVKDDGDVGFATTAGWTSFPNQGFQNDITYAASGTGSEVATWTFTGLPSGTYKVSATWHAQGNRATNSPFTVLDGATPFSTVNINQELTPNDFSAGGASWEDLGAPYVIVSGTLAVRLTNLANEFVIADAIRIEKVA